MAAGRNNITLIGALAEPPILTETRGGRDRALFTVAGLEASHTTDGRPRNIRWRHRVSIVGPQADSLADLQPGTVLLVQGTLRSRDDKQEDGSRRQRVEVYGQRAHTTPHPGRITTDDDGRYYLEGGTNQTTLEGNLTRDIETRHTQTGIPVARGTLVTNISDPRDPTFRDPQFLPIILWGELAERHQDTPKGARLYLQGKYLPDNFITSLGEKIYRTAVEATDAYLLDQPRHTNAA